MKIRNRVDLDLMIEKARVEIPSLPNFMDSLGYRLRYAQLSPEQKLEMQKAVKSQDVALQELKMLRAERLCHTHKRAIEIIRDDLSSSVFVVVENVIKTNGDFTVYDVSCKLKDIVSQVTEKELSEFKEILIKDNAKFYKIEQ